MAEPAADETRPSPEALLEEARKEKRGKLKIFLGAAPGVGKTYQMLLAARRKKADGVDVVVGVVETHGRVETQALLDGLEVLPRKPQAYKGRQQLEMDLDAILKRRPQLVLVDELAHTNAAGSRHPKRYQDVEELLAAGINVWSTLNIQHLESLNDVIARITQVRVRETVPDRVFESADEVEVVDVTPDELIQRLHEGKVYSREQAQRALQNYFKPGNLTALRELALRRTAERVDEQMRSYMRRHAIPGPWAASERILVMVSERPIATDLVRYAKRVAERLDARWIAAYVETARTHQLDESERERIHEALRLAERLGADTVTLPGGARIADAVLAYARENNVTQIVIGKSRRTRWFELLHGSVVRELVERAGGITVHVVAEHSATPERRVTRRSSQGQRTPPSTYLWASLLVATATAIAVGVDRWLVKVPNISLVFIGAVLWSAVLGRGPSLFAAVLSAAAYNFFFLPPYYTFTIGDPANVLAFGFFTVVAVIVSRLAANARTQALSAASRARTTAELLSFSRRLAGIRKGEELFKVTVEQVAAMLHVDCVLLTPEGERLKLRASAPETTAFEDADLAAATWCWQHNEPTGRGANTLPGVKRLFVPLRTGRGQVGVLGVRRPDDGTLAPDERRLLNALADLAAISLERVRLAKDVDQARMLAETEKLRSALLTSISHDLRTPLASIMGAISNLRSYGSLYDEAAREELLAQAQDEAERLNRFVANLLDMTRLDAGALEPKREACDLRDIVGAALRDAARLLARHKVVVRIRENFPWLLLDFVLMEQVLLNLLDNAAKYSPPGSIIEIAAARFRFAATVFVRDEGPGIPQEELERIFDKFRRVQPGERHPAGLGLGLAVCRGFVDAMGGRIHARNRTDRSGAEFAIDFPQALIVEPRPLPVEHDTGT